jgi:hypothetical protein
LSLVGVMTRMAKAKELARRKAALNNGKAS